MDPNATLKMIHNYLDAGETVEAAALFVALDASLRKGEAYLPDAWRPAWAATRTLAYEDGVKDGRAHLQAVLAEAYRSGQDAARGDL